MAKYESKNEKDLVKEVFEKQKALRDFRFGIAGSKARNVREGRGLRREIARVLTELHKRHKKVDA